MAAAASELRRLEASIASQQDVVAASSATYWEDAHFGKAESEDEQCFARLEAALSEEGALAQDLQRELGARAELGAGAAARRAAALQAAEAEQWRLESLINTLQGDLERQHASAEVVEAQHGGALLGAPRPAFAGLGAGPMAAAVGGASGLVEGRLKAALEVETELIRGLAIAKERLELLCLSERRALAELSGGAPQGRAQRRQLLREG